MSDLYHRCERTSFLSRIVIGSRQCFVCRICGKPFIYDPARDHLNVTYSDTARIINPLPSYDPTLHQLVE